MNVTVGPFKWQRQKRPSAALTCALTVPRQARYYDIGGTIAPLSHREELGRDSRLLYRKLHEWPTTREEAYAVQAQLCAQIDICANCGAPQSIAAVETAYGFGGQVLYGAAVIVSFPEFRVVERAYFHAEVSFPYVPGLFYFREGPVAVEALSRLENDADLVIVSAHGLAHPRKCGMACFVGLAFDKPTIGCSRRLLAGEHRPVGEAKGSSQPIILQNEEVGVAYRSKDRVKPIYVSPGHKCDVAFSRDIIVKCLRGYRLPEPLRIAHTLANKYQHRFEQRHGTGLEDSES